MIIKEVANVHAEGYCSGEFKHGPLALLNDGTPFIFIIHDDEYFEDMIFALNQIKNRNALTIVITDCREKIDETLVNYFFDVPHSGMMTSLLSICPI